MLGNQAAKALQAVIYVKALGLAVKDHEAGSNGNWDHLWKISNPGDSNLVITLTLAGYGHGSWVQGTYIIPPRHSVFFINPAEQSRLKIAIEGCDTLELDSSHDIADEILLLKEGFASDFSLHYHNDNMVGVRFDGRHFIY
jgi:hypothetical protein